jgi:hypothetical protein
VIHGKEKERDDHAGESDGVADDHDAFGLVVGGEEFVVKEAIKKMTDKDFELGPHAFWSDIVGLDG